MIFNQLRCSGQNIQILCKNIPVWLKYIIMKLSEQIKSNLAFQEDDSDSQCDQNLQNFTNYPNRILSQPKFQCLCCFKHTIEQQQQLDTLEKKRQKRRQHKKRQKIKKKQAKEEAFKVLEEIICDIYEMQTNFNQERVTIEKCLDLDRNQDRFYEFINTVIRQQVDVIKQQTQIALNKLNSQEGDLSMVHELFKQFNKIKQASPEVEKIINLFIRKVLKKRKKKVPLQKNLDRMTFKFILKNDSQNKNNFQNICKKLYHPQKKYLKEQQMLKKMIITLRQHQIDEESDNYDSDDEDYDNSTSYSSEESDKLPFKGQKRNFSPEISNQDKNKFANNKAQMKKNKKRRHNKAQYDMDFDIVMERIENLQINEEERLECNVEESWLQKISEKIKKIQKNQGVKKIIKYHQSNNK